jgi:glycogen debranching enzyme
VTYDQTLYIAALRAFAELCDRISTKDSSEHYLAQAETALQGMQRELWDEELGYFINYRRPGFSEKNLSADSLVTAYFHLLDEAQTQKELTAADFLLRAAHNHQQPLGNFGLLCAFPLYSQAADLFDKSALPYCYHNGADWPYLDGIYASILLERRDPAGLEVLTRWWSYGLKQGWLTPVEYYSPAYPVGGMLQGWSSMPAAVLFRHLMTIKEILNEAEAHHADRQS